MTFQAGNTDGKQFEKRNRAAEKHGAYRADRMLMRDRRTSEAQSIAATTAFLTQALGGDVSPQQALIIQRVSVKALRLSLMESQLVKSARPSARLKDDYIKWSGSMREDLKLLGLERRVKDITPSAAELMKQKAAEKASRKLIAEITVNGEK